MAINFPSSPSVNQTYVLGDRTWIWTGTAWQIQNNVSGYTGSQGYTGSKGDIGYTGSAGANGSIGYTGSAGSSAATAGQVIQVVTATDSTERSTTSTSFVTGSNTLSVSITPAATANKIFVIVSSMVNVNLEGFYTVFRGATDLGNSSNGIGYRSGASFWTSLSMTYLDSPNTTSSTTYEVRFRTSDPAQSVSLNRTSKASITLMEIKG